MSQLKAAIFKQAANRLIRDIVLCLLGNHLLRPLGNTARKEIHKFRVHPPSGCGVSTSCLEGYLLIEPAPEGRVFAKAVLTLLKRCTIDTYVEAVTANALYGTSTSPEGTDVCLRSPCTLYQQRQLRFGPTSV